MEPLSENELLILLNQYRILELLDPDEKLGRWKSSVEILEHHYTRLYERCIRPTYLEDASEEVYATVRHVLDLYYALQTSVANFTDGYQPDVGFPGFSGNYEIEYMHLAEVLLEADPEHYPAYKKDSIPDSHEPMVARYEKMLAAWENVSHQMPNLTEEQVKTILEAA